MFFPKRSAFLLITLTACTEPVDDATEGGDSTTNDGSDATGPTDPSTSASTTTAATTSATTTSATSDDSDATDDTDASTSQGSDDTSDSGGPVCEGDCAIMPDGWNGPVVMRGFADDKAQGCNDLFATEVDQYGAGFNAPDATCECSCDALTGASCSLPSMRYNLNSCAVDVGASLGLDAGCNDIDDITDGFFHLNEPVFSGGDCDPIATVDVPPAAFADDIVLCSAELDTLGCDADTPCVPPIDEPLCIWDDGEQACPEAFPVAQLLWTEIQDDRSCTTCTCGDAEGGCEMNDAILYPSNNVCMASFDPLENVEPGGCNGYDGTVESIYLPTPDPVGSCAPSPVEVIGAATPVGMVTVCCSR